MVQSCFSRLQAPAAILMLVAFLGAPTVVFGELPPGSYDKLRSEASEALIIEVTSVTGEPGLVEGQQNITVKAKILGVERSASGLKKGATIEFKYLHIDLNKARPGFVGPRQVPILEKGSVYPAFLKKGIDDKGFQPAAYGESFKMTPER